MVSSTTVHDVMVTIAGYGSVLETATTNLLGQTTRTRTDGAGRVIETVDAAGFITKFEYDANGNRLRVRDPNGVGQDCQYDALNRDILCADTQELLDGVNRRKEYDLAGNVLKQIDAKGNTTFSYFDSRNRRFETKDRNNATTSFTHDAAGNELSMTDAENQTTSYLYDQLNRRTKITWPDHVSGQQPGDANCGFETTAYDAAGRAILKTNQLGDTIALNYDPVGRMLSRDYRTKANSPVGWTSSPSSPNAPQPGPIADQDTFTYDTSGRMLTATKGRYNNTVTFTYEHGRKLTEALTILGQTYTVTSGYDAAGRETSLLYPDGSQVTRTFTNRGQLASVNMAEPNAAAQPVSTFTYDNGGRETSRTYGNGVTTTRAYAADNMVTTINAQGIESLDYTYDANKNPTSETRSGVMSPFSWSTGQSGFDPQNRLTNWTRTNGDSQQWNLTPVNDWQSVTNNNQTQTQTRTHGPTHELQSITQPGSTTPVTLQHDPRGNLTQDDRGCSMTYDADKMLASFTANNAPGLKDATYQYDALGRRVSKSVTSPASGNDPASTETTIYALAGQQVIAEYSPSGSGPSTLNSRLAYGSYIDEPLVLLSTLNNQPSTLFYHPNRQYSPYTLTDATGNPTEHYTYTPYGQHRTFNPTGTETPNSQPQTLNRTFFTGRTYDQESGLHYFRRRYYEAPLGRFTSHDPILYPDGWNTYAGWFAIAVTDPSGMAISKSDCDSYIKTPFTDKTMIGLLIAKVEMLCGKKPNLSCDKSPAGTPDGIQGTTKPDGTIVYYYDKMDDELDLIQAVEHELIHALDYCIAGKPPNGCKFKVCMELRAYSCSTNCDKAKASERDKCIRQGATNSSNSTNKECLNMDSRDMDKLVLSLMKDPGCMCADPCRSKLPPPLPDWFTK